MNSFSPHVDGYHDVADQMVRDLHRRADALFRQREAEQAALTSVAAFEADRERVKARFLDALGGLPGERTPLRAAVTGEVPRDGFTLRRLVYESLPGFLVTAALYVPHGLHAPAPAVLFLCGHAEEGKAYPAYQAVCGDLARNGFVVLAMDPPGQGERFQTLDPATGERRIPGCTGEHTAAGLAFTLSGASVARHFLWDAIRAVDLLCELPEVDAARIGVTGNSGGGTQTCFLMMAEPRLAAAMPCTFVMTLESYLATGQPQDAEQIVRGAILHGPDHDDYLTALAPKPVRVGVVASDFFPIEGTREAVRRAKRVYALYGREEHLDLVTAPGRHEYARELREAAVNFFGVHLQGRVPSFRAEPLERLSILPERELWATPTGQVATWRPESRTLFDLGREYVERLPSPRLPEGETDAAAYREGLRERIAETLGGQGDRSAPIDPRVIWEGEREGYGAEKLFFFSEPGIVVTGIFLKADAGASAAPADLVLLPDGTSGAGEWESVLKRRLASGRSAFLFDVRGTGGVLSREINAQGRWEVHGTEYRLAMDAMMMGISTLGLRVFDVLRGYDYLRSRPDVGEVGLIGAGRKAVPAIYAAALEPGFDALTCVDGFVSYRDVAHHPDYDPLLMHYSLVPWGIAREGDLVDLLPLLSPRPTTFVRPHNARNEVLSGEDWHVMFMRPAEERGYLREGWRPLREDSFFR